MIDGRLPNYDNDEYGSKATATAWWRQQQQQQQWRQLYNPLKIHSTVAFFLGLQFSLVRSTCPSLSFRALCWHYIPSSTLYVLVPFLMRFQSRLCCFIVCTVCCVSWQCIRQPFQHPTANSKLRKQKKIHHKSLCNVDDGKLMSFCYARTRIVMRSSSVWSDNEREISMENIFINKPS